MKKRNAVCIRAIQIIASSQNRVEFRGPGYMGKVALMYKSPIQPGL